MIVILCVLIYYAFATHHFNSHPNCTIRQGDAVEASKHFLPPGSLVSNDVMDIVIGYVKHTLRFCQGCFTSCVAMDAKFTSKDRHMKQTHTTPHASKHGVGTCFEIATPFFNTVFP